MIVILKARIPELLKYCSSFPVDQYSTKNHWMTSTLFVKQFHESFVVQVRKFQVENNLIYPAYGPRFNQNVLSKEPIGPRSIFGRKLHFKLKVDVFLLANSWDNLWPEAIAKCRKIYFAIQLITILLMSQQIQKLKLVNGSLEMKTIYHWIVTTVPPTKKLSGMN